MLAPIVEPQRPLVDAPGPEAQAPVPTTAEKLDETARRVRDGAARFARLTLDERIALARAMQAGYVRIAEASVRAGCAAKGIAFAAPAAAEEWATGPWCVIRHLRLVREQLESIRRTGNTRIGRVGTSEDGRTTVQVFPDSAIDGLLFQGCRVEVRMQKGIGADAVANKRASFYRGTAHDGRVTLVLGAGNLASIGPMDVITKLFNEGSACILKMSPVNAYLGPFIESAFASAIERGYLAVVYGGAEQGAYLSRHVSVDELHLTGSDATHDAIVWGPPGPEREARQRRGEPLCGKPVSSELGNVSPVIVVPGPYSEREIAYQAEDIASYVVMNAGFLCNAARVLITPRQWAPRTPFLQHLERVLQSVPPRKSYYPGAVDRWWRLTDGRDQAIRIGRAEGDTLPWTVIPGLDAADRTEPLFTRETFCPVVGETSVGSSDPVEFLERAVEFANERLWGTLSATLVVHPKLMRERQTAQAVERAIARLRYGTVTINTYSGMSFAFGTPPWGAYPGATSLDIQSGRGWVHNTGMLEGVEKVVVRFPLTMFPKPVYFPSHRTAHKAMRALLALDVDASWRRLPAVMLNAMRG